VSRLVAGLNANSFVLGVCVVLLGYGLYLFLTRSADPDGTRGSFGLVLLGGGTFLVVVLVLQHRRSRSQKS
jgi:multisubunit Na+/H+ antiporter MnhB subunit